MKKRTALFLAAALALSLSACGGETSEADAHGQDSGSVAEETAKPEDSSTVFTITREDGASETLTADELKEIYDTNEINFNDNYDGISVEAEGTISKVENDSQMVYLLGTVDFVDVVRFTLSDRVQFQLTNASIEEFGLDVSTITAGTKVRLTGSLGYANFSVVVNYPTSVTLVDDQS